MIREIIVTNPGGERLPLTLMRPESSGLIVKEIQGLGPAKSNVNIKENAVISGSVFNSIKTPSRNIVLALRFMPSPTIEAARLRTYRYFPSESRVHLEVKTDKGSYYIFGFVESNEPSIFSENQECIISIICPDPFFRSTKGYMSEVISSIGKLFEFPFSEETIIFGEKSYQAQEFLIPFKGTINVGPTLTIEASGGQVNNPSIYFYNINNPNVVENLSFNFTESLSALNDGDRLTIVCEPQNKSVVRHDQLLDNYVNYIGAVTLDSSWPLLRQGDNYFSYNAESGAEYIRFTYSYELRYSGV